MFLKNNSKIPLDKFINKVLYDKTKGYYMNNNPIGDKGDFITSPNISIMFSQVSSREPTPDKKTKGVPLPDLWKCRFMPFILDVGI